MRLIQTENSGPGVSDCLPFVTAGASQSIACRLARIYDSLPSGPLPFEKKAVQGFFDFSQSENSNYPRPSRIAFASTDFVPLTALNLILLCQSAILIRHADWSGAVMKSQPTFYPSRRLK